MEFAKRFKEARKNAGMSVAEVADRLGISTQSVYLWEQGSIPKSKRLNALADLLGVPAQWLVYGDSAEPTSYKHEDGTITVPYLRNIEVSAGGGKWGDTFPIVRLIDIDRTWASENLGYTPATSLAILAVSGDSMIPTFEDKDTLLLDQSICSIRRDGLYVVAYDGMLFSKRFQVLPKGRLLMLSDNKMYNDVEIDLNDDQLNFQVLGRIIYHWHGTKH